MHHLFHPIVDVRNTVFDPTVKEVGIQCLIVKWRGERWTWLLVFILQTYSAVVVAMDYIRLEFILFRMAYCGFQIPDGLTAKIELLSSTGAWAWLSLAKSVSCTTKPS